AENSKSLFFLCELAEEITSAGQYNIDLVAKFISKKAFKIKYEDTDSLYLICPDKYYKKNDRAFNEDRLFKEEYWSKIVKITIDVIKSCVIKVDNYMEYLEFAKEQNMKININYYLESMLGLCAWFINKDEKYQLPSLNKIMQIIDSDKREKQIDVYFQKEVKKWLEKYIKSL
ncbi:6863_t:CDS:2, partial [Cetraspora pellucida]